MMKEIKLKNDVQNIIFLVVNNYTEHSDAEWLSEIIDKYHYPNKYKKQEQIEAEDKSAFEQVFTIRSMEINRLKMFKNAIGNFEYISTNRDYYSVGIKQQKILI